MFETEGFSYILERATTRLTLDVSFAFLKAILWDNVKWITLKACLLRKAQSLSFIPSGLFTERG